MKKYIYFLLLTSIIFYSCSKNTINSSEYGSKPLGKVSISIDKVSTPSNVATIIATLTKVNSDTLTNKMNLSTDTTGNITFQNIAVGTWDLIAIAEDINGTILYKGESSVEVNQGTTTTVGLTLNPVGSIKIDIIWGTNQLNFVDYSFNPIYTKNAVHGFSNGISQCKILLDNGTYKMWYNNMGFSGAADIWYAVSSDGINWYNADSSAALTVGASGSWDGFAVSAGAIIKDGSTYKLYYNGVGMSGGGCSIGLATSIDGVHWQKYADPVLTADQNEGQVGASGILLKDGTYYLYYTAHNHPLCVISLATSTDGVHWNKYSGNPVIKATQSWEGVDIYSPSYINDGGQFKLVYMNANATGFGLAYSSDGVNWQKDSKNPFFIPYNSSSRWTNSIAYPDLHKFDNQYCIYYTGYVNGYGAMGILKN